MADSKSSRTKRWYDQQETVSKSVSLMESFPSEFQVILGESVIELAETHCNVAELMSQLRTLGPEKVLGLFKSKSKRRASDQLPEVHQAMNYMYILSEGERIFIANHIIGIVDYFYAYFKICKEERVQPSANIARQVCKAYLQGDLHDPSIFVAIVRKQIEVSTHYSFEYASQTNWADLPGLFPLEQTTTEVREEEFEQPMKEPAEQTAEKAHREKVDSSREGLFIRKTRLD